eukprot:CAMPEP_0181396106 /NCGR_PEP_ID=MMETSP1106-20121128/28698_1 /TAXON_ID=81844 /ORGANISM="Mantoniella antarctica, Strain SL-175" /LENGTH=393 /DNA_ID=CAMNT_0023517775 /DNA_START=312 /DNA_END=1493 /DNA_ORIENTATION=+
MKNPAIKRIVQEMKEMRSDTGTTAYAYYAEAVEDDIFEWHFAIFGPEDSEFDGGVYHGRILLPTEYPFKPPSFMLLTPSGRFETQTKICLSITQHHPEHWQPSWSVRTALLAVRAFMPSPPEGAVGSLDYTHEERRRLAARSRAEVPQFGNPDRQALTQAVHDRMVGRWAEIEANRKAERAAAEAGAAGSSEVVEGDGGGGGEGASSSTTAATVGTSEGVNVDANTSTDEGVEMASTVNPWAAVAPAAPPPTTLPIAATVVPAASDPAPASISPAAHPPPPVATVAVVAQAMAAPVAAQAEAAPVVAQVAPVVAQVPPPLGQAAPVAAQAAAAPVVVQAAAVTAVGRPGSTTTDSPAVAILKRKLDFLTVFLSVAILAILLRKFLVLQNSGEL